MPKRWLASWVMGVLGSFAWPDLPPWWLIAAVLLCMLIWAWRSGVGVCAFLLVLGMAYGFVRTELALKRQWPAQPTVAQIMQVKVAGLIQRDGRRARFAAVANVNGRDYRVVLADYGQRDWPVGSVWQAEVKLRAPIGEVNRVGFNREAWALYHGVDGLGTLGKQRRLLHRGEVWGWQAWRAVIMARWQRVGMVHEHLSDGLGLMQALSVGEQSAMSAAAWQAFRPLGLNHLVSISGLHVGMVALLAMGLMKLLLRSLPKLPREPRLWQLGAGVVAGLFYAGLAGFAVPTQRSVLMLCVLAWAWWRGSNGGVWRAWWWALAMVLLFDPLSVLGAGFWLSFGLVAILFWVGAARVGVLPRWRLALAGQGAVSLLSVVALGGLFASLPLISPLVNVVAIPWFSWLLTPLALFGSMVPWPPLQVLAAWLGQQTLWVLMWLAKFAPEWAVAQAPWLLLLLALVAALVLLLPRGMGLKPWAILVLLGFVFFRLPAVKTGTVRITVWDVGQGLSVLFQTAHHQLLFDTGTDIAGNMALLPNLNAAGVRSLDALVLSHHDNDHDGGFAQVVSRQQPRQIWAGQPEFYAQATLCQPQSWQWDGVQFSLIRPSEKVDSDDNNQSCVLRVWANGQALLITGDLGQRGEQQLMADYGTGLFSQVLVLGHHGSNSASSSAFLNVVSPQYAVASAGFANGYHHPAAEVQNRVRAHGVKLLRTDREGGLLFELGGEGDVYRGRLKTWRFYWQKKPFDENEKR